MATVKYLKGTRLQYEAYIKAGKIQELNFYYITGSESDPLDGTKHLFLGLVEISNASVVEMFENHSTEIGELHNLLYAVDEKVAGLQDSLDLVVTNKINPLEERVAQVEADLVGGVHYRGSVPTIDDLPENPKQGDLYEIEADGSEYCYNGEKWFVYGSAHFVPVETPTIAVNGKELSVKVADGDNALKVVDGGLFVEKCNFTAIDRVTLDNIAITYATKTELSDAILAAKEACTLIWEDLEPAPGVASINGVYYSTVDEAIKAAKAGDVIVLETGEYGVIEFPIGAAANLTIQGSYGVKVQKVYFYALNNVRKPCPENLTLKNITFNGGGVEGNNTPVVGLSIINCVFTNKSKIRIPNQGSNITVKGCDMDAAGLAGDTSTLYFQDVNGLVVTDNHIRNSYWNAVNVTNNTSGKGMHGTIIIENNTIKGTGSRAMRLVAAEDAVVSINNNKMYDANRLPSEAVENDGEIIKVSGVVSTVTFGTNTYEGKVLTYTNGIGKVA